MSWLAVDKDGAECIFSIKPSRGKEVWSNNNERYVELSPGTIKKLIGRRLTWKDEPVELDSTVPKLSSEEIKKMCIKFSEEVYPKMPDEDIGQMEFLRDMFIKNATMAISMYLDL